MGKRIPMAVEPDAPEVGRNLNSKFGGNNQLLKSKMPLTKHVETKDPRVKDADKKVGNTLVEGFKLKNVEQNNDEFAGKNGASDCGSDIEAAGDDEDDEGSCRDEDGSSSSDEDDQNSTDFEIDDHTRMMAGKSCDEHSGRDKRAAGLGNEEGSKGNPTRPKTRKTDYSNTTNECREVSCEKS